MRVGWLGTGLMGGRMAARVRAAGHELVAYNRTAEKLEPLVAAGARAAATPREAARDSDLVIAMVSDADALAAVLRGPDGALAALAPGGLVVDMSTIGAAAAVAIGAELAAAGARFVDAPVIGGRKIAARGDLVIVAGGAAEDVERARPVLAVLGKQVFHAGAIGTGQLVKAALSGVQALMAAGMAEGAAVCRAGGARDEAFFGALDASHMACELFRHKAERMRQANWQPGVSIDRVRGDLALLIASAGVPVQVARAAHALVEAAARAGMGASDYAALVQLLAPGVS